MLWRLFKKFDVDDSNFITKQNLIDSFQRLGKKDISEKDIDDIISTHDIQNDGQISFEEFKQIFIDDSDAVRQLKY